MITLPSVSPARLMVATTMAIVVPGAATLGAANQPEIAWVWAGVLALVTVLALAQLVRWLAACLAVTAAFGYAALPLLLPDAAPTVASLAPVGLAIIPAIGLLAELSGQHLARIERTVAVDRRVIDELNPREQQLGTTRWVHARLTLDREISRARRYEFPVTFVVLAVAEWQDQVERGAREELNKVLRQLSRQIRRLLREADEVSYLGGGRFALILPHTDGDGAHVVIERSQAFLEGSGLTLRAGIVGFPEDGVTLAELVGEAEAALKIALATGRSAVCRELLEQLG